jgi:hypothetical protein
LRGEERLKLSSFSISTNFEMSPKHFIQGRFYGFQNCTFTGAI